MTDDQDRGGLLAGIRVLDLTMFLAGPYCSRLLADVGAEVIKIEPASGDFLRNAPPVVAGTSRYFAQLNSGKKSIVLNLKDPSDHQAFLTLAKAADVVVENFRPGVMKRLGLDYDAVRKVKPDVIYCSISGYGQSGPDASRPAFAPIVHAAGGVDISQFEYLNGALDKPPRNRNATADVLAGTHAFGAIAAALYARDKTGHGQYIDVPLIDSIHNLLGAELQVAQADGDQGPLVFSPIRANDGFVMATPISQANFEGLARTIKRPDLIDDPKYSTARARIKHFDELMAEAELWSLGHSAEYCEQQFLAEGCPATRYYSVLESIQQPGIAARGAVLELRDSEGSYLIPNSPFSTSNDPTERKTDVPSLGEHTSEIIAPLKSTAD